MCLSFFFSSRRRHTRWPRDWSSDVCSSDLDIFLINSLFYCIICHSDPFSQEFIISLTAGKYELWLSSLTYLFIKERSEERRVGKECISRVAAADGKQERYGGGSRS